MILGSSVNLSSNFATMGERFVNKFLDISSDMWESFRSANGLIVGDLQNKVTELKNELYNCQQDLIASRTDVNLLRTQNEDLTRDKDVLKSQKDDLKSQKDALESEIIFTRGTIAELEFEKDQLSSENKRISDDKTMLQKQVNDLDSDRTVLLDKVESLNSDKSTLEEELEQERGKSARFRNMANIYERRFDNLNKSVEAIKTHLGETSLKRKYSDISDDDCILVAAHYPS